MVLNFILEEEGISVDFWGGKKCDLICVLVRVIYRCYGKEIVLWK